MLMERAHHTVHHPGPARVRLLLPFEMHIDDGAWLQPPASFDEHAATLQIQDPHLMPWTNARRHPVQPRLSIQPPGHSPFVDGHRPRHARVRALYSSTRVRPVSP